MFLTLSTLYFRGAPTIFIVLFHDLRRWNLVVRHNRTILPSHKVKVLICRVLIDLA